MILRGSRCQCAMCGEYFTRSWFDRHRVGPYMDRWCLSEVAMEALGMVQRQVREAGPKAQRIERLWCDPRMPLEALTARRQSTQAAEAVG